MRSHLAVSLLLAACASDPSVAALESALSVPCEIQVPPGNHIVASYSATGLQIYECRADASGALAWAFRAPAAALFADDGSRVAVHFGGSDAGLPDGPYWQSLLDGSRVHGGNAVSAPNPGAIPLLRLEALDHAGSGIFSDVTFIQRLDTAGGVGPTGACRRAGVRDYVPYTATYVFWAAS